MNRLYMIEFFINTVKAFSKSDEDSPKQLIVTLKFGPKSEFIIKESDINSSAKITRETDVYTKQNMWVKHLKSGKSYIFPSYADTLIRVFEKFRLEASVWDEDITENDNKEFVGTGSIGWDPRFMKLVAKSTNFQKKIEPLALTEEIILKDVNCCSRVGYVDIVIRLTAMASNLFSTFQRNKGAYLFQSSTFPNIYEGTVVKGEDTDFCLIGSLYASISLEREVQNFDSCKQGKNCSDKTSNPESRPSNISLRDFLDGDVQKLETVRIADIKGPCGYAICPIAQKIKMFLRDIDSYKVMPPEEFKLLCECEKSDSTEIIPSKLNLQKEKNIENWWDDDVGMNNKIKLTKKDGGGLSRKSVDLIDFGNQRTSAVPAKQLDRTDNCVCLHEECLKPCYDPKCDCLEEERRKKMRILHKPFCPAYIHKTTCPLTNTDRENAENILKCDDEDKTKSSLGNVPPICLGPCPVPGKPCKAGASTDGSEKSVKVTETRKDKNSTKIDVLKLPAEKAPKRISCSREFEQLKLFVKQALAEFKHNNFCFDGKMPHGKRCCDKETVTVDIKQNTCCVGHKMGKK